VTAKAFEQDYEYYSVNSVGDGKVCEVCEAIQAATEATPLKFSERQPGINFPPLHPWCRCKFVVEDGEKDNKNDKSNKIKKEVDIDYNIELFRRKKRNDGNEIIDKSTYNKLVRKFLKNGGIIIRGEQARKHLEMTPGSASYFWGGNIAIITDDATVSDVLEEMYHAEQDRKGMYSDKPPDEAYLLREIDAQKYLIKMTDKYKIPSEEIEITMSNLNDYEEQLRRLYEKK